MRKDIQDKLAFGFGPPRQSWPLIRANDEEKAARALPGCVFASRPRRMNWRLAKAYLDKPRKGCRWPAARGGEEASAWVYEDILWAVLNTKEFLFNH